MKNDQIRSMAFMGLYAALYITLWYVGQFIPFLKMPQGGSIELELAALFVASFHLGWKKGLGVAALCWVIELLMGGAAWYLNPMQYALDYLVPFAVVALAQLFGKGKYRFAVGVVISMILKYVSTVLSGVYYWPPEDGVAGSAAAWVYSLSYNAWYNLATCIVCVILVPVLLSRLQKLNKIKFVD